MDPICESLIRLLKRGEVVRVLAFGSSNTERRLPGMHWFDCLDLAIAQNHGRNHRCINTGIGGDSTLDLLRRFEEDAAFYKPHAVFLTIGGNDSHPDRNMGLEEFERNLMELQSRFARMGTLVFFQTYYAPNSDGGERFQRFFQFSDIVRKVARETGAGLIDHLRRWERLRQSVPEIYLPLMEDDFHVIERGNKVMGVDLARHFGMEFRPDMQVWGEALQIQQIMDRLESQEAEGANG